MPSSLRAPYLYIAATLTTLIACDSGSRSATSRPLVTAQDSTLYAVGQGLANQFSLNELFTEDECALINQGLNDGVLKSETFDLSRYLESMNTLIEQRRGERSSRRRAEGDAFVALEGNKEGAVTTESSLV
jgi:hypothetical protein